jgi:hypothetical protein
MQYKQNHENLGEKRLNEATKWKHKAVLYFNSTFLASSPAFLALAIEGLLEPPPPDAFAGTDDVETEDDLPARVEAELAAAIARNKLLPLLGLLVLRAEELGPPPVAVRSTRFRNGEGRSSTGGGASL